MEWQISLLLLVICGTLAHLDRPPRTVDEYIAAAREKARSSGYKEVLGDAVLVEGDMLMTKEESEKRKSGIHTHNGLRDEAYRWTNNIIPYYITNQFSNSEKAAIKKGMDEWEVYTCLKFVPWNNHRNYIYIHSGGGCSSWVGMLGGRQDVSLARGGCVWHHTIVHELGHAIGFHHEQTRPDRDDYVTIYLRNVAPDMRYNFDRYSWNKIDDHGVPYDYRSVMHYGSYAFSTNRQKTIVTKDPYYQNIIGTSPGMSFRDIKLSNLMYKCASHCNVNCPDGAIVSPECKCWCASGNARSPVYECDGTEGSGGEGSGEPDNCGNNHERCQEWADRGECTINPEYMLWNCPKSCQICGDDATCIDYKDDCDKWAFEGFCKDPDYQEYMSKFCRPACAICDDGSIDPGPDPDCVDLHERCQEWANRGECRNNPNYMLWNCPKACRLCGDDAGCEDYDSECDQWSHDGYCKDPEYEEFMSRFCRKACGC